MLTFLLKERAVSLQEEMDKLDCDPTKLAKTYHYFGRINAWVAMWRWVYVQQIRPLRPKTLLDIGCGGGDLSVAVAKWAKQDGFELSITAIDPDDRAIAFATQRPEESSIIYRQAIAADLRKEEAKFDVVISNHLLHHLNPETLLTLCEDSKALAIKKVIHNDLRRSDLAYLGYFLTSPFFRDSFITTDGLRSIRRSFTREELESLVPEDWQVLPLIPYRNLLLYRHLDA